MAQPYYLISAEPRNLKKIAKYARSLSGLRHGDPVQVIGSHRIVLLPVAVGKLLDNASDPIDPARSKSLVNIVQDMGAQSATAISTSRVAELLAARASEELDVPRILPPASDLVIDNLDWHLQRIHLPAAWDLLGGPDQIDWQGIRVGQIDTGFRPIPCLGFAPNGESGFVLTDSDRNFFPGDFSRDDYLDYGQSPRSEDSALDPLLGGANDGHGTRTGSVLAGRDTELDYFGAAPRVPYIPVRISDSVIINHVQGPLALAIEHLVRHGCGVITLSLGMALTYVTDRLRTAIDYAYEQGVILVTAAGNVWDPVVAPARLNRTLAVGGSTPAMTPWLGSSFGPEVDICAPAWPIRRATVDRAGQPSYGHGDGTSFAAPLVAGTAALWLRYREEEIRAAYPEKWQRVEAFKRIVTANAQPGMEWNRNIYGAGILDSFEALQAELPDHRSLVKDNPA
jgi:subtilisin family serine protease